MTTRSRAGETTGSWRQQREEILDAAVDLLAERGYSGATMQAIAERAGCSVGYLYRHFESKLALVGQLVVRELAALEQIASRVSALGLPPLVEYRRYLEELSDDLVARRPLVRVLARESLLQRLSGAHERLLRHRRRVVDVLRRARERGELAACDIELLAAGLQGAVDALAGELAARPDPEALRELPDHVFDLIIDPLRRVPGPRPRGKDDEDDERPDTHP